MRACIQRLVCIPRCGRVKKGKGPAPLTISVRDFTGRDDKDDGESDNESTATSVAGDALQPCPTCWRIMPRPSYCPRCRLGAPDTEISLPTLHELKTGSKLFATISGAGLGMVHRITVTRLETGVTTTNSGTKHALALHCVGVDEENGHTPGDYFIPLDMDALMLSRRQVVPVLINDTKLGICTVLVTDRPEHTQRHTQCAVNIMP